METNQPTQKKEMAQAKIWTDDPELQRELINTASYLQKVAIIGNSREFSKDSVQTRRIDHKLFDDFQPRRVLDMYNLVSVNDTFENDFAKDKRRAERSIRMNQDSTLGTGVEILFFKINEIVFDKALEQALASVVDNKTGGVDSIFFGIPFETQPIVFGVDYTLHLGRTNQNTGITQKLSRIAERIIDCSESWIKYAQHPKTGEKLTVYNAPKLVCYLHSDTLERLAEYYYKRDEKKIRKEVGEMKEDIIFSFYIQTVLFSELARLQKNTVMHDAYTRIGKIFKEMLPADKRDPSCSVWYTAELVSRVQQIYKERIGNI